MTEQEFRDLDAEVAVKVLGLPGVGYYGPIEPQGGHPHLDHRLMSKAEARAAYLRLYVRDGRNGWTPEMVDSHMDIQQWREGWGPVNLSEYSLSLDAAGEVMEYLRQQEGVDSVSVTGFKSGGWLVSIRSDGGETWEHTADWPPLALCYAALDWARAREEEGT